MSLQLSQLPLDATERNIGADSVGLILEDAQEMRFIERVEPGHVHQGWNVSVVLLQVHVNWMRAIYSFWLNAKRTG